MDHKSTDDIGKSKTAPEVSADLQKQIDGYNSDPTADINDSELVADKLDSPVIDKVVEAIVEDESDTLLAAEDAAIDKLPKTSKPETVSSKFKRLLVNKWSYVSLIILLLATIMAVPVTRYAVLGLVVKRDMTFTVIDSKTSTPVSNALVSLHGKSVKTDAYGKATIKIPVGNSNLVVSKQYFQTYNSKLLVNLNSNQTTNVSLVATGRQVPVTVVDAITGKPLAGAQITILDTTSSTDSKGQATIVLPTTKSSVTANLSMAGYNPSSANIQVTNLVVTANTVGLMPVGHIYFLSNLSGKIDVVRTNLDGSDRQIVLAGTGKEDPNTTSLLATSDWRFLVLKAQRDSSQAALYVIDTATDKVSNFDSGDTDFTLIGWYGHSFLYDNIKNTIPTSQTGHETIKSYNADTAQLNLLDQNQAVGTSTSYAYQSFYNFYIINGSITYVTQWYAYSTGTTYDLTGKSDTIRGILLSNQTKKDYQSLSAANISYIQTAHYQPDGLYYSAYNYTDSTTAYYAFDGQTVTPATGIDQTTFSRAYPTYLLSPSASQTFWTELRDGKNTLFIGDKNSGGSKQLANLSAYVPYGWYSDNYLLVSKGGSELYIMPSVGLTGSQQPVKISDYYKPAQTYNGYGYGGL